MSHNQSHDMMSHLEKELPHLLRTPGLIGITLNGGLSRGTADEVSEIDLTLYLERQAYDDFYQTQGPLKEGICILHGQLYDIRILCLEKEEERVFAPDVALWDLSQAIVLHDPQGRVHKLIESKCSEAAFLPTLESRLFESWWFLFLAGDQWIHRKDPLQGHYVLSQGGQSLLAALYLVNKRYVPHDKWIVNHLSSLPWLPSEHLQIVTTLLSPGDLSMDSLIKRQRAMKILWRTTEKKTREVFAPQLPVDVTKRKTFLALKTLLKHKTLPISTFKEMGGTLRCDPFSDLVVVEGDQVRLNRQALDSFEPSSLYCWHASVVKALLEQGE